MNYDELSPGIRHLVRALNEHGFETTDSGDGTNFKEGMECSVPYPMVVVQSRTNMGPTYEAECVWEFLIRIGVPMGETNANGNVRDVEATYSVHSDSSFVIVTHVLDTDIRSEATG